MQARFLIFTFSLLLALSAGAGPYKVKDLEIEDAYKNDLGRLVVRLKKVDGPSSNGNLVFYGTEKSLFLLDQKGFGSLGKTFQIGFSDPQIKSPGKDKDGEFYAGGTPKDPYTDSSQYTAICGASHRVVHYQPLAPAEITTLQSKIQQGHVPLIPLPPEARQPELLLKRSDGSFIYVDRPRYSPFSDDFRLFVGFPGKMEQKKIISFEKAQDKGLLILRTRDGDSLSAPRDPMSDENSTWNKKTLEKIELTSFDLSSLGIEGVSSEQVPLHTPCDSVHPAAKNSLLRKNAPAILKSGVR